MHRQMAAGIGASILMVIAGGCRSAAAAGVTVSVSPEKAGEQAGRMRGSLARSAASMWGIACA